MGLLQYEGEEDLKSSANRSVIVVYLMMEEFRPLIVDSVVLSLLNNRQLQPKHFTLEINPFFPVWQREEKRLRTPLDWCEVIRGFIWNTHV